MSEPKVFTDYLSNYTHARDIARIVHEVCHELNPMLVPPHINNQQSIAYHELDKLLTALIRYRDEKYLELAKYVEDKSKIPHVITNINDLIIERDNLATGESRLIFEYAIECEDENDSATKEDKP